MNLLVSHSVKTRWRRIEAEFETKLKALKAKYEEETTAQDKNGITSSAASDAKDTTESAEQMPQEEETEQQKFQRKKLEKAARKREEARRKEREAERALEAAKQLPNAKTTELANMQLPAQSRIEDVPADGHCLYRAVAAQIDSDYQKVRTITADSLVEHRENLEAFCESHYDDYVDRVRNSADWGGHLELRALSLALKRPIIVYSTGPPLTIGDDQAQAPIRLSYHLHYYALGEHYNHVVVEEADTNATES